jgi:tetratricopeptide (TPR) repeat protein
MAGGLCWIAWRSWDTADPPGVDPTGADPQVLQAIEESRTAVRKSPHSATAWGRLGKVLLAHNYYPEARACFARAEQLDPREARWPYLRGLSLEEQDMEDRIACFQRAVELNGETPALRLQLAVLLLGRDQLDAAEEQFRQLLVREPENPRGALGLAQLAFQHGDLKTSRQLLTKLADSPFARKAAQALLAQVEQRCQDTTAAARASYRASVLPDDKRWPDPIKGEVDQLKTGKRERLRLAVQLYEQKRPEEAIVALLGLQREYPDWDQVWFQHGFVLYATGQLAAAEDALRRALQLAPDSVQAHFFLGLVRFQKGNYAAAADSFREATRLRPNYARAYFNLAQSLIRQGDKTGARDSLEKAVCARPNYAEAYACLGELLAEQGDREAAVQNLHLALEVNPDEAWAKKLLDKLSRKP